MLIRFDRSGSFVATDAALNRYEIVVVQETIYNCSPATEPYQYLQTVDGRVVIRKGQGSYELADSGVALRSIDPRCI